MTTKINLQDILCHTIKDITKRVAGLELTGIDSVDTDPSKVSSLVIFTKGGYTLTLVLSVENAVLQEIAKYMKHQENILPEDIPIYTGEYYNILCGHIVTVLNHELSVKARFGIPSFVEGLYSENTELETCAQIELCFQSAYGWFKLKAIFKNHILEFWTAQNEEVKKLIV